MAKSNVGYYKELKKRFTECPICLKEFDERLKQPWYLPCLHNCCSACLQKLINVGRVVCPLCKEEHNIKKLDELVKNNTWRDYLDYLNANHKSSEVYCENCNTQKQATYRCLDCSQLLCLSCYYSHQTMKCLKDHITIPIKSNTLNLQQFGRRHTCPVSGHGKEYLKLFCRRKSCGIPICVTCLSSSHKYHAITDMNEIYLGHNAAVQEAKLELQERNESISSEMKIIQSEWRNLQQNSENEEQRVVSAFDEFIQCLEQRKEHLRNEIHLRKKEKEKKIQVQIQNLTLFSENVTSAFEFLNHQLAYKNDIEFINLAPLILGRLTYLKNKNFDHEPIEITELQFKKTFMDGLKSQTMHIGELEYHTKLLDTSQQYILSDFTEPNLTRTELDLRSLFGTNEDMSTCSQHGKSDYEQTFPKETMYSNGAGNCKYLQDKTQTEHSELEKSTKGHSVARRSDVPVRNTNTSKVRETQPDWSIEDQNIDRLENMSEAEKNKAIVDRVNRLKRSRSVPNRTYTNDENTRPKPKSSLPPGEMCVKRNDEQRSPRSRSLSPRTFTQKLRTDEEDIQRQNMFTLSWSTPQPDPNSPLKRLSTSNPSPTAEQNVLSDVEEVITPRAEGAAALDPDEALQHQWTSITCPQLELDENTLPIDLSISRDRKKLCQRGTHKNPNQKASNTYVGVIASKGFEFPDNIYFEVEVTYRAGRFGHPVEVFAMWFAQQNDINAAKIMDERKYKLTVNIKRPRKVSVWNLSVNLNGRDVALPRGNVTVGVNMNTPKQRIVFVERRKGILIGKIEGVDFSQKLWPVFQISKEKTVNPSITLHSGNFIEKIPLKLLRH